MAELAQLTMPSKDKLYTCASIRINMHKWIYIKPYYYLSIYVGLLMFKLPSYFTRMFALVCKHSRLRVK